MSSLLTIAGIEVGKAVAKSIFKLWVKDDALSDMSANLVDLVGSKTSDPMVQRRGDREFQDIADKISEEIVPVLERDGAHLDEGERAAVAHAVAETLNKSRLSRDLLLERNLQPTQLEQHVRAANPNATRDLSEAATQLYNRIIKECCTYIVDIATQLPAFNERTFAELLKRGDQIGKKVDEALAELRKIGENLDPSKAADRFEKDYRESVARNLDVLNLIGADVSLLNRRHKLSVAYISLSVAQTIAESFQKVDEDEYHVKGRRDADYEHDDEDEDEDEDRDITLPVETVLASSKRLLIQGMAGSGKTTLLQWIAVRAATNSFEGELAKWNGKLPFYIRLRQYANAKLPRPKDFPEFAASAIFDTMPERWIHEILKAGRAIVLVDGVDEVSAVQREEVHSWLRDLIGSYGECTFVVTSRPHAIEEGWMNHESFGDAMLQDMEMGDIYHFIEHWHEAVRQELQTDEEKRELEPLAEHLKEQVRRTRAIQKLATNPLLCAMLCALNRERRQQLPVNRIELYEACSSLLLERREKESKIDLSDYPALSYGQKQRLLQDLAYWMIHENLSEARIEDVDQRFAQRLVDMPNIAQEVTGKKVRKLLVERAAVLREPVAGRLDFTHRTFEEYFAAQAITSAGEIEELIARADDDQWREVIILTAGFVTKPLCEQLVLGLIERGDEEEGLRYQLHLIAVACLETAIELGAEVRAQVEERLSRIVPPKNITNAKALAEADELAIKYLDKKRLMRGVVVQWNRKVV